MSPHIAGAGAYTQPPGICSAARTRRSHPAKLHFVTNANGHAAHELSGAAMSKRNPAIKAMDVSNTRGGPKSTPTGEAMLCHASISGAFAIPRIRLTANANFT